MLIYKGFRKQIVIYQIGYEEDIKKFNQWLKEKNYAPKSVHNGLNTIRVFLKEYRIRLDDIFWENFNRRGKGKKPIIRTPPLEKHVLKMILTHADARCRAAFLTLAQSGMRPSELVQLTHKDIDWASDPVAVRIVHGENDKVVKDKEGRTTYITYEAADAIRESISDTVAKESETANSDIDLFILVKDKQNKETLAKLEESQNAQEAQAAEEAEKFRTDVLATREIAGFKITEKEAMNLYDFITQPEKDGKTAFAKKDNENNRLLYAYFAMKDFNKDTLSKEVARKQTIKLKKQLSNYQDKNAKPARSGKEMRRGTGDAPKINWNFGASK